VFGKRYMLIAVEGMFSYMQRHAWEEAPRHLLIYEEDRPSEPKKRPRPITESVLAHLLSHLDLLHPYARNLVAILSVVGLRAIDTLHLTEACLEFDATGDPRLHWYNHKLKRDDRPLPVTMEVAEAIQRQQALVREIPDLIGQRYLFRTKRGLYLYWLLCISVPKKSAHDGSTISFSLHYSHQIGGVKVSCMTVSFLIFGTVC
jgi:integrase